ncbi:multiple sugar transport system permease protein/raffinose/stachyose/melibiose transport system permease protein [Asanoa ferruginea]|uniref:Multiple sugar transport system permease protein/raffinose/stachyose/melibiose transport system permease protein n=1 Tax=Asanoa ferruginea TaxID=53367 RepID=A0A3D9ZTL2_9ACTN|nr:sugar ABC transporter permease [Asanoa ferruginea]REG00729.1 multiple sugar transport system permease protein/raffinose/stachyose/melibiose transport system permease protein [Asanoa ferruginea]GIF47397.1 ABC transporter permease [Asanoa ferruginea]
MTATDTATIAARLVTEPRRTTRRGRNALVGYAFIAPAVLLFLAMGLYTLVYSFGLSFAKWNGFSPTWEWVGLDNYKDLLFADPRLAPEVRNAAVNTGIAMVAVSLGTVLIALPLATLLNSITRLRGLLRSVFFLPYVTAGIAVYYAWRYVLEPQGAVNLALRSVGLGSLSRPQGFLADPDTALPALVVIMIWGSVPVAMLLYLAGLQAIDPAVIEAASLDGAGPVRRLRHITWPLLVPITVAILLLGLRDTMQGFQIFLIMTNGGPGGHTDVLGLEAYQQAFLQSLSPTLGVASALGWLIFIAALLLAVVNARLLRSRQ